MGTIDVVLFDLGNVLVDLGGSERFGSIFQVNAKDESVMWEKWLHSPAVKAFDRGLISLEQFAEGLLTEMQSDRSSEEFIQAFIDWPVGLFDGAKALLDQIPPSYHKAVLSNTNDAHWGRILDEMGLAGQFHSYFASHQEGHVKPDDKIFHRVIEDLGVAPERILFLDDNWLNIESARKLGMHGEQVKGVECAKKILYNYNIIA